MRSRAIPSLRCLKVFLRFAENHIVIVRSIEPHQPPAERKPPRVMQKKAEAKQPFVVHQAQTRKELHDEGKMAEHNQRLCFSQCPEVFQQPAGARQVQARQLERGLNAHRQHIQNDALKPDPREIADEVVILAAT